MFEPDVTLERSTHLDPELASPTRVILDSKGEAEIPVQIRVGAPGV